MLHETNDSIFIIPGEGLFCHVRRDTVQGYFSARGLESLILQERQHGRDTEELEQQLFTLRRYNREVIRPLPAPAPRAFRRARGVPGQLKTSA